MAIARGPGTEIIRSVHYKIDDSNTSDMDLIVGVQHHIYTVLSIICYADVGCDNLTVWVDGYDAIGGTSGANIKLFKTKALGEGQTYVFNDKFSFNGTEPTDFTSEPLSTAAEQDLIADQATTTSQYLRCTKGHNNDQWHLNITYIDQNNS